MAIIDLRHLVTPEYDTIKFTGDIDKIEYELPMKKTVNSVLLLQDMMNDFNSRHDLKNLTSSDIIELGYVTLTAWVRTYYPDLSLDWVKNNLSEELYVILSKKAEELFFPDSSAKQKEPGTPKRTRKRKKS